MSAGSPTRIAAAVTTAYLMDVARHDPPADARDARRPRARPHAQGRGARTGRRPAAARHRDHGPRDVARAA